MILILLVTLGYLPHYSELLSLSITTRSRTKRCSRRKGASCVWNRPGPSLPSRHCRCGHGVAGKGWTAAWLEAPTLTLFLPFPNHRPLPPNLFVYLLASQTLLPTSLSCQILEFSPSPPPPRVGGGGSSKFPAGYQLPPSCGPLDIIFMYLQPSPILGGQGCHG